MSHLPTMSFPSRERGNYKNKKSVLGENAYVADDDVPEGLYGNDHKL